MALLQLNLNPSNKDLRWFAGIWFPAFWGLIGLLLLRRHFPAAAWTTWGFAVVLAGAGLAAPPVIRPVYAIMMRATYPIGWVMSYLVMALAYFVVFTAFGQLMRLFHDPMQRKLDRNAPSYWLPWEPADPERYFRQM